MGSKVKFVICVDIVFLFFVICAKMATASLLRAEIDAKHRAKRWEDGEKLEVLITRTPKFNWMIHPAWHQRYVLVYYIFHLFLCDAQTELLCFVVMQVEMGWAFTVRAAR